MGGGRGAQNYNRMKNAHAKSFKYATCNFNRTARNTLKLENTLDRTDRQTYRHFFIAVLGLWEANKPTKKILAQSEKITDGNRYGIICPEFFGHIIISLPKFLGLN